jgi:hypothetical protein
MKIVNYLSALILAIPVLRGPAALAQAPSMKFDDIGCGIRIRVPNYPAIARAARITGAATAAIRIAADGHAAAVEVSGAHPLLRDEVERELRISEFSPTCDGRNVHLVFEFVISGQPVEHPQSSVAFMPPNRFVVSSPPGIPMP